MILLQELQLLLVLRDAVAHGLDTVADLVETADQIIQMQLSLVLVVLQVQLLLDLAEVKADLFQVELELLIGVLDLVHSFLEIGQRVFLLDIVVAAQFLDPVHQGQRGHLPIQPRHGRQCRQLLGGALMYLCDRL